MSSAIELYREAYDLDFNKGDISYAEVLYKELIERYPHSDEKEYAEIHLERIAKLKGNPGDPMYTSLHGGGSSGALAVVSFVLSLLTLLCLGFGFYFGYRLHLRCEAYDYIIQGMQSERNGSTSGAILSYEQAQKIFPQGGIAYHCLADLHLRTGKLKQAELVGRQWELVQPYDPSLKTFQQQLADSLRQEKSHEPQ